MWEDGVKVSCELDWVEKVWWSMVVVVVAVNRSVNQSSSCVRDVAECAVVHRVEEQQEPRRCIKPSPRRAPGGTHRTTPYGPHCGGRGGGKGHPQGRVECSAGSVG